MEEYKDLHFAEREVKAPVRATKPPTEWRKAKATPAWQYAAAEALHAWIGSGKELTEPEYDAAIERAASLPLR